jgi:hypothetical protein
MLRFTFIYFFSTLKLAEISLQTGLCGMIC